MPQHTSHQPTPAQKKKPPHKARVLQLSTVHPWDDNRICRKICVSLVEDGYDVTLLAREGNSDASVVPKGVELHVLQTPKNRIRRGLMSLGIWRRARKLRPDIVHFHDPELIPAALLLKLLGYRVVYDVHEHVPDDILTKNWIPWIIRYPISLITSVIESTAAHFFSAIIAVTSHIGERFPKRKTILVKNYPRLSEFSDSSCSSHRTYSDMIYIGAMTSIRGIREMIDGFAMASAPNRALQIMGTTQDSALQSWIDRKQAEFPIVLNGWCERETVRQKMSHAIAGLLLYLPNKAHCMSLPTKMFEYMGGGVAIIASNYPLWQDIIDEFHCGRTVDPEDPHAIAKMIDWFYANPDKAREMGEAGRKAVEKKINWEMESLKLLDLYKKLL